MVTVRLTPRTYSKHSQGNTMLLTRSIICASLLFGVSSALQAQETALETTDANRIQPEAREILEKMAAFYKTMIRL